MEASKTKINALELFEPFQEVKDSITIDQVENQKRHLKIVIVGEGYVGKTTIIHRLHFGKILEYFPGYFEVDISYSNPITLGSITTLTLWDTAAQEDYDRLRPLCYPGTDVFCICFTRVRPVTFSQIKSRWIQEINHHAPNTALVLMGCKYDLLSSDDEKKMLRYKHFTKIVNYEDAIEMARDIGAMTYIETSAVTGEGNVSDFAEIVSKCHASYRELYPIKSKKKKCIVC